MLTITPKSSLYKPMWDRIPEADYTGQTMLANETVCVQFVIRAGGIIDSSLDAHISVKTALPCQVREVRNVPVMRPTYERPDDDYESRSPGVYPDALRPVPEDGLIRILRDGSVSIWVTINPGRETLQPGRYPVEFSLSVGRQYAAEGELVEAQTVTAGVELEVLDAVLPVQQLIYTNWFHCDCLCDRYGCEMFDEKHWAIMEKYIRLAALTGMNMILTPCFTPPLDTAVGAERMTAQLIDVEKTDAGYRFGFDRLRRFLRMCTDCGIVYFEHSHLFTQWGAAHAPKVMGTVNGEYRRLFGWETDALASDGDYADFLRQYLTALLPVLEEEGIGNRMYFHISDEPGRDHLENYKAAHAIISPLLKGYHIFDALSRVEFYRAGAVDLPIPTTSHARDFIGVVPELWLYYTGYYSYDGFSNRLIAMPNARNRSLGVQMWYHDTRGFLQWAYNFWYTRLSRDVFDPWSSPDADCFFVGGTSFMVYPGDDEPVPSMRLYSFAEGLDDMRALDLYASRVGREKAMEFLLAHLPGLAASVEAHGTALQYAPGEQVMRSFREALNRAIVEA